MIIELLKMFFMFFKIGLFTFGGGYAMIPLMKSEAVDGGYVTADMMYDFIGISESTPGPFAVNMATFIGMSNYGIIGAIVATLGIVLPSFIIILMIASLGSKFIESDGVKRAFLGLKPAVIGLITTVSIRLVVMLIFPNFSIEDLIFDFSVINFIGLSILVIVTIVTLIFKNISPLKMIALSAVLGMILYSIF
jgi:chromate transporter